MRNILLLLFCCYGTSSLSQNPYAEDVQSPDQIMAALYESISGDKGEKRDWDRFRYLFIPEARLLPSGPNQEDEMTYRIMSPDEYIKNAGKRLEADGFHEIEIARKTETFGSMVHIWSTYASFRQQSDSQPFMRGINSIQLMYDGERWWIMQIYWRQESEANPIPKVYLPQDK
ncbi:MAG: hypothetical protein AAF985_15190 [Bacteroidota bacterium]